MLASVVVLLAATFVLAAEEPVVYTIKQGDTLWGLSARFLKDPHYWPDLWSRNPAVGNPHFIYPGQKVHIYPDRVEEVPPDELAPPAASPPVPSAPVSEEGVAEAAKEQTFLVTGGEGFLAEKGFAPLGYIISTSQSREIVGEDDIVYTDLGATRAAKVGERFSVYKKMESVSHPVSNVILGDRVIPLGVIQVTEVEKDVSKAIVTKSFQELGPGAYLMPYEPRKREISLKAGRRDLQGYIVASRGGTNIVGAGDIVYLDLGSRHGVEVGNFLYVVRDLETDRRYDTTTSGKLPPELLGAVVVVETAEATSTALVVKSIDTIYRGDRVELKKPRQ
jgi:LysM repeat protein